MCDLIHEVIKVMRGCSVVHCKESVKYPPVSIGLLQGCSARPTTEGCLEFAKLWVAWMGWTASEFYRA